MVSENELKAALLKGERVMHNESHRVIHQNSRGYYIVAENGKRLNEQIRSFYDAVRVWKGGEDE